MRSTKGLFVLSSAFCILLFMAAGNPEAAAQGANMMTVQGRLTDSNGAPLNGMFDICIRFWDASAAGTKLFGVKYTNVGVNNGIYTIVIGESASAADDDAVPTYTTLSALMASNPANLWMGIKVSTDSEMTPRSRISSNINSLRVGDGTYFLIPQATGTAGYIAGSVGIGDATPDGLLDLLSSGAAATQLKIGNTNVGDYDTQIGLELVEGTNTFSLGVDDSDADKFKISTTALGTGDSS
jgi:hypothetical protein